MKCSLTARMWRGGSPNLGIARILATFLKGASLTVEIVNNIFIPAFLLTCCRDEGEAIYSSHYKPSTVPSKAGNINNLIQIHPMFGASSTFYLKGIF